MHNSLPVRRSPAAGLFALGAIAASLVPTPSRAQDAVLAPVIVSASRLEQPLTDALPHTTVISRADIERAQVVDLRTLLQREAGMQTTANGGPGSSGGLFIRGAPSSQVLLLVDGVPMTKQDATGSVSRERPLAPRISRISRRQPN